MYKGAQSLDLHKTGALTAATWALGLGGGVALLVIPTALPVMKKNVIKIYNEDGTLKVVSDIVFRLELTFVINMVVLECVARWIPWAPLRNEDEMLEGIDCN